MVGVARLLEVREGGAALAEVAPVLVATQLVLPAGLGPEVRREVEVCDERSYNEALTTTCRHIPY